MPKFKYYEKIRRAQSALASASAGDEAPFDLDDLNSQGFVGWLSRSTSGLRDRLILAALWFFREFYPNPRFFRLIVVTRDSDIREVLQRPQTFHVPFGLEMSELTGGGNFVLGMDGAEHDTQSKTIQAVMLADDIAAIRRMSRQSAETLVTAAAGRIDVMQGLMTRVAVETCCGYFGLAVDEPDSFAEWTIAMSALIFADPFGKPTTRRLALYGAARVRTVVDQAIAANQTSPSPDTIVGRLVARKNVDADLTDEKIRAIVMGLVIGFIPTNSLGAGKMLQALLDRPQAMRDAVDQAQRGDAKGLRETLIEAARLNPALSPGQWRYANQPARIAAGSRHERAVPANAVLMVATMSALRDRRATPNPGAFQSGRPSQSTDLVFGYLSHKCVGEYVAMTQITETFATLLAQPRLRPCSGQAGRIVWAGPFPRHLEMQFDAKAAPAR
jgi:cytochrome P450